MFSARATEFEQGFPFGVIPAAVRARNRASRHRRARPLAGGSRGAGRRRAHRRAHNHRDRTGAGTFASRFRLRVAARPVLARLEPLRGFAADVRGDPLVGERAAFWRAPRSVHRRLQRGDRRQPVPARRAARRGSGTPACSHRGRRGRYRRHRPARRRGCCTAPSQRLPASAAALACALSALDDGAQIGDAARLAGVVGGELETGIGALVSAGVLESGGTVQFAHPILRAAIHGPVGRRTRAAPSLCRDEPTRAGGARRPSRSSRHAH